MTVYRKRNVLISLLNTSMNERFQEYIKTDCEEEIIINIYMYFRFLIKYLFLLLQAYSQPEYTSKYPKHQVEYLVFEILKAMPNTKKILLQDTEKQPFNLTSWLNKQHKLGNTFCGPVAGGSIVLYKNFSDSGGLRNLSRGNEFFYFYFCIWLILCNYLNFKYLCMNTV